MVVVDTKFDYPFFIDMETLLRKDQRGQSCSAPCSHVFITGIIWTKVVRRRSHSRALGIVAETQ